MLALLVETTMKRESIARLLPDVFQRTLGAEPDLLGALLGVMQDLHAPVEDTLARLETAFQTDYTPVSFLAFLAGWLDLDRFLDEDGQFPPGSERLRALIREAANLYRLCGTRQGLERFLETATGIRGFEVTASAKIPFHLLVRIPRETEPLREFIHKVVQAEKPAYATVEVMLSDERAPQVAPPP
jgi:phage tail-like protein